MTLLELKNALNQLPSTMDNYPIWLGTPNGYGFLSMAEVLVENAKYVPLDADDRESESLYLNLNNEDDRAIYANLSANDYTIMEVVEDGTLAVYREIIILANSYNTVRLIELNKTQIRAYEQEAENNKKLEKAKQEPEYILMKELEASLLLKYPALKL